MATESHPLLAYNAQHTAVTLKDPSLKTDVERALILGYESDSELKQRDGTYVYSRCVIPMVCHASPLLVLIGYDKKAPYVPAYTTSIATLFTLRAIMVCYGSNPFLEYRQVYAQRITESLMEFMRIYEESEIRLLDEVPSMESPAVFVEKLASFTLWTINAMETCVHQMFDIKVPLASVLTPPPQAGGQGPMIIPPENQDEFDKQVEFFFAMKRGMAMERTPDKNYFPPQAQDPKDLERIYCYNSKRIKEYFAFLHITNDGIHGLL